MGFFSRLFRGAPTYAVYVDRSEKGNFSARIVSAHDNRIADGAPTTIFVRPVRGSRRFRDFDGAIRDAAKGLQALGLDHPSAQIWVERGQGKADFAGRLGAYLD